MLQKHTRLEQLLGEDYRALGAGVQFHCHQGLVQRQFHHHLSE